MSGEFYRKGRDTQTGFMNPLPGLDLWVWMTHHRFRFDASPMLAYQGFALYNCRVRFLQ
jgi:hypothetical protein